MEDLIHFTLAAGALLLVPGPTNTLLATSGATIGFLRSLRLLLSEVSGYAVGIAGVRAVLLSIGTDTSGLTVLRVLSAAYLAGLAFKLWRAVPSANASPVTMARVFVTTMLNPKVLIVGLVLMSLNSGTAVVQLVVFSALVPVVAVAWISAGCLIGKARWPIRSAEIPRVTAIVLLCFAGTMIVSSIRR